MPTPLPENTHTQRRLLKMLADIRPKQAVGVAKKRYGRDYDGGYVMLDTLERAKICYSLGVSDDFSWDLRAAEYGADVFMYDHTVTGPALKHDRLHFHKVGIAPNDGMQPYLRPLDTLIAANGHGSCTEMVLKMDIEVNEWPCYDTMHLSTLELFDQIVCEFHHADQFLNAAFLDRAERVFAKLAQTHQVVHVHGNNNGSIVVMAGVAVPNVFELTFARRSSYEFASTAELFPGCLDMPCTPAKPELHLGSFAF